MVLIHPGNLEVKMTCEECMHSATCKIKYSLVKDFIFLNYVSLEGGEYNIVEPIWLKFLASQCIWRKREVKDGDTPVSDRPGS